LRDARADDDLGGATYLTGLVDGTPPLSG